MPEYGFLWLFGHFGLQDISKVICIEINWDRHGEAAYEIFSIEHRFWRSVFDFLSLKKPVREGIKAQ